MARDLWQVAMSGSKFKLVLPVECGKCDFIVDQHKLKSGYTTAAVYQLEIISTSCKLEIRAVR